jgi:replication-associated recombination protein RarA
MLYYEKHRPKSLSDVLCQETAKKRIRLLLANKEFDRGALWIEGASGIGKTTLARAIAAELHADTFMDVVEVDACGLDLETVRKMRESGMYKPWGGARVIIVNEAQTITSFAIQALLTYLEALPERNYWIFTSTESISDPTASPLKGISDKQFQAFRSRVIIIKLDTIGVAEAAADVIKAVAERDNLGGAPLTKYIRFIKDNRSNIRAAWQAVMSGEFQTEGQAVNV